MQSFNNSIVNTCCDNHDNHDNHHTFAVEFNNNNHWVGDQKFERRNQFQ